MFIYFEMNNILFIKNKLIFEILYLFNNQYFYILKLFNFAIIFLFYNSNKNN